jgi:two-component system CheB/CheR fusion protein
MANTDESKKTTDSIDIKKNEVIKKNRFPIVGVGASAGGLEALQDFFDNMAETPGVAFVVIQHLSPDYKSFMSELLARHTSIPIEVATDNVTIKNNHIYMIPPKMNITIQGGKLHLKEIIGRHLNLPIDIFLRSLAADQEDNAIGIILSGTGSDGTLGIKAIKEAGGITMAQDEQSAKFDGMPKSSISTGMVDYVLPPKDLASELVNYAKHPFVHDATTVESQLMQNQTMYNKLIAILHDAKNVDFSNYKQNTIIRRLEKRISINRFDKVSDYVSYLSATPKEVSALFNDLLIGVTRFFRDEKAFESLKNLVIPEIFMQHTDKSEIRAWVPACSTGEEAYSLAILFKEYMTKNHIIKDLKIFATDIDEESIAFAGVGFYPSNIVADVSSEYLAKYFIRKDNGFQINENIRRMIIFARHNIIDEPPFSKLDFVSCRNLLIYLNIDVQQKILATFHMCLCSSGFMFLGSSESLGKLSDGFDIINTKAKLFKKNNHFKPDFLPVSSVASSSLHSNRSNMLSMGNVPGSYSYSSRQLSFLFEDIASHFLSPSVIVDDQYNVLYTIHDVSDYIHLPKGQITTNILRMLNKEMSVIVSSLIRRAEKVDEEIIYDDVLTSSKEKKLSISCKRFKGEENDTRYFLISFIEKVKVSIDNHIDSEESVSVSMSDQYQARIEELEQEIQRKNESLQATVEELETSNEELQSSNEELIASNEELQSTNEELQSVNEELYTVNSEHIRKIEELTQLNADYDNTLKNTCIGTLFLDNSKVIRKVSSVASTITNVLSSDIGRPIQHLALDSLYKGFKGDIDFVIETLDMVEREVQSVDKWYLMRMMPFRTIENAVNGIIITFVEMTKLKQSQLEILSLSERLKSAFEIGGIFWHEWDVENDYISIDNHVIDKLGYALDEFNHEFSFLQSIIHPDDLNAMQITIQKLLKGEIDTAKVDYRLRCKNGDYVKVVEKMRLVFKNERKYISGALRFIGI